MSYNLQNLIPNSERSREELQEMGRRGGKASGETRRRQAIQRKRIREAYEIAAEMAYCDGLSADELRQFRKWLREHNKKKRAKRCIR